MVNLACDESRDVPIVEAFGDTQTQLTYVSYIILMMKVMSMIYRYSPSLISAPVLVCAVVLSHLLVIHLMI